MQIRVIPRMINIFRAIKLEARLSSIYFSTKELNTRLKFSNVYSLLIDFTGEEYFSKKINVLFNYTLVIYENKKYTSFTIER